jgi:hypothetical protein
VASDLGLSGDEPDRGELVAEGRRLLNMAEDAGLALRLLGGIAVALRSPSASRRPLRRRYKDIDCITRSRDRKAVTRLFEAAGYVPNVQFNTLHAPDRLIFRGSERGWTLDVFVDAVAMCHRLELADRLTLDSTTLTVADLLLLKLQAVERSERDCKDVLALLIDHPLAPYGIDGGYIAGLLARDWGWWRTATGTLDWVERFRLGLRGLDTTLAGARIAELRSMIDAAPKSRRWKLRARVGERVRWYDEPDEPG